VHDAAIVGRFESRRDLLGNSERFRKRYATVLETVGQRLSGDELPHESGRVPEILDAVKRGDVRVVQGSEEAGLAVEARASMAGRA
jgi:hypothetical protein